MKRLFQRAFTEHPRSVDETYMEHLIFALGFSGKLLLASAAALVHALIPAACEKTASTVVKQLYTRMHNR